LSPDARIAQVARKQHGVFTKSQARKVGLSLAAIRTRRQTGRWVQLHPGVYALAGTPVSWKQDVIAATMRFGAIASGKTAARLLGILDASEVPIHLTLAPGQRRTDRRGLVFHEAALAKNDVRTVDGIRCTGPERTLVDLAGLVAERALEAAFDDTIQDGLTTIPKLDTFVTERGLDHNRGVKRLRRLIADRAEGAVHKELERMFRRKLSRTKLPKPVRQFPVGRYFIDFAWPDRMVAVELHGLGGHFSAEAFRNDKRRENVIVLAGFKILHFGWEDVCDRWPDTETTLRQSLDGTG